MYCFECGNNLSENSKFCPFCGKQVDIQKNKKFHWFLWWQYNKKDISIQVEKYNELGLLKSYRGISVLLLLLSTAITWLFIVAGKLDAYSYADIFIMIALAVFIYFGIRWATIGAMIYITLSKIVLISSNPSSVIVHIIWWAFYMEFFFRAWKVEQLKRKVLMKSAFN